MDDFQKEILPHIQGCTVLDGNLISEGIHLRVKTPSNEIKDISFYAGRGVQLNHASRVTGKYLERVFDNVQDLTSYFSELYDPEIEQNIKAIELPAERTLGLSFGSGHRLLLGLRSLHTSKDHPMKRMLFTDASRRSLELFLNRVANPDLEDDHVRAFGVDPTSLLISVMC